MRQKSARVLGFVRLGLHRPCFLLPIFGSRRNPQVQQVDAEDRVVAFSPCSLTATTKLIPSRDRTRQEIGARKLHAFQFERSTIKGTKTDVQRVLRNRLRSLRRFPHLSTEVEAFLGTNDAVGAFEAGKPLRVDLLKLKKMRADTVVAYLAAKYGTPKKTASTMFDELLKLAVEGRKGGTGKFVIPNISRVLKAHIGRNPQTGEPIKIKAKTAVRLRPTKGFKHAVLS